MAEISYRRHRFPPVIIQHAVWLYLRFTLSYRDVEEVLAERGLDISYETIRCWVLKFGPMIACRLRRCRPRPSNRWHLDEMAVRIAGERMYLWRAVDHECEVLDMLVHRWRDTRAALRLMRKLLKKQGFAPKFLVTDKLRSYASAFRPTRAQNAAVQIRSLRPAVSQHACPPPQHLLFLRSPRSMRAVQLQPRQPARAALVRRQGDRTRPPPQHPDAGKRLHLFSAEAVRRRSCVLGLKLAIIVVRRTADSPQAMES